MHALHGGQATPDTIAAHKLAGWRRGGLLPQASVDPAAMRATRDLLRRRMYRPRPRAARLAHSQHTNRPYHRPASGTKLASTANRDGVAERCPAPAGQQSMAVDLALRGSSDPRLTALAWHHVNAAQPHDANPLALLQPGPGIGNILSLVRLDAIHEIQRFPRGQECGSSGRLVTCANASAGQRSGTAGSTRGPASLTWAVSDAAGRCLRDHPAGQTSLTRRTKTHGLGQALTRLAQPLGRAVSARFKRHQAFAIHTLLCASGAARVRLTPHGTGPGGA